MELKENSHDFVCKVQMKGISVSDPSINDLQRSPFSDCQYKPVK